MNIIRAKQFSLVLVLLILLILALAGCSDNSKNNGYDEPTESDTLTDEIAVANAKMLNEKYNLEMDKIFNLKYTASEVETDGYNRYIVRLVYEYENSKRQLNKTDLLIYYTYEPETRELKGSRLCFYPTDGGAAGRKFGQDGWEYLKQDESFGWGTDPNLSEEPKETAYTKNMQEQNGENGDLKPTDQVKPSTATSYISEAYEKVFFGMAEPVGYSVFDMDSDGVDELIVKGGTCEADYTFMFYAYKNEEFIPLGSAGANHSILVSDGGNGVIIFGAQMGYEWADRVVIKQGTLNFEALYEKDVGDEPYTTWDVYIEMHDIEF